MAGLVEIHGPNRIDRVSRQAMVGRKGNMHVEMHIPDPPGHSEANRLRYFSALLGSTGADSGTTNMNVNGGTTAQRFYVQSVAEEYDIHVMKLIIFIGDSAVTHGNFGNVSALGTGWDLKAIESGETTLLIDKAKTTGNVIRQAGPAFGFGDTANTWELTNYSGTNDAALVIINLFDVVPEGIRLGRGNEDRIESVVNDDLTGLVDFTVRAIGYRHYP